ncbi:MAG: hypothetical protein KDD42_06235 [Bdellovibrionales bacterium]|nr:hypothetical protein [Bdellovibrionales bacterium]
MKIRYITWLWLLLALTSFLAPAMAETRCTASISYEWLKKEKDPPIKTEFVRMETVAANEPEARQKLSEKIPNAKSEALQKCRSEHESVAECLATKYSSMTSVINSLGFEARKSVEEAIKSDCSGAQGSCQKVEASEIECAEIDSSTETAEAQAGEGKEKKEEKKK